MGADTRNRFVEAAGELLERRGYHGTGINDILRLSGAPRGSLYHYFPDGKDQLVVEALRLAGERTAGAMRTSLGAHRDLRKGLKAVFEVLVGECIASGFTRGCPVASTALAIAGEHEEIRAVCAGVYADWIGVLRDFFIRGGCSQKEAARLARFAIQEYEGALILARVERSQTALVEAGRRVLAALQEVAGPS